MLPRLKPARAKSTFGLGVPHVKHSIAAASLALLTATAAIAAPPDNASPLKSQFTTLNLDDCKELSRDPAGNAWLCPGLPGYPVYVAEGDLRYFMSFGARSQQLTSAKQTLGAFNTVFRDKRNRFTVEWRYVRQEGRDQPYAAIVRYFTSRDGEKGQVIVVTRISPVDSCHMAYIDALATQSAIALARSAADELARGFDCKSEPRQLGGTGRSPM